MATITPDGMALVTPGGPGATSAPVAPPTATPGPKTPALPNNGSIVDFLNTNGIPADKNTRAQIYQSMGLGSTDDYLAGIGTGETNTALLNALAQSPGTVSSIAGGIKAGQAISALNLKGGTPVAPAQAPAGGTPSSNPLVYQAPTLPKAPAAPLSSAPVGGATVADMAMKPGETQDQYNARMAAFNNPTPPTPAPGSTLPGDTSGTTSDINSFQKAFLDSYSANKGKADAQSVALDAATVPLTSDQILANTQHIQDATGYTADQTRYNSILSAYNNTANDVRQEAKNTGGILTEGQVQEMVHNRNIPLQAQLSTLATDMATKKALVDTIMQQTQTSRQDAANKAEQLMAMYNGNANTALTQAADFYKTKVSVDQQAMNDKINIALKYGLDPKTTDFVNSSLADIATAAMPKAQTLNDLTMLQKQIQSDTLNLKLQQLQDPLSVLGYGSGSGLGGMTTIGPNGSVQTVDTTSPQGKAQFLASLPAGLGSLVQQAANYQLDPTKVTSMRGNQRLAFMQLVAQVNPNFDATMYPARAAMVKNVTSGTYSQAITAANTLINHLGVMAADAKNTSSFGFTPLNSVANWFTGLTGGAGPSNFMTAAQAVASEAMKVYAGTGGGASQDIENWKKSLSPDMSADQKAGAISQMVDLMAGKLGTIGTQYNSVMGNPVNFQMLTPDAVKTLTSLDPNAPSKVGYVHVQNSSGQTGWIPPGNVQDALQSGYTQI